MWILIKSLFLRTLYNWIFVLGSVHSTSFFFFFVDLIDILNFRIYFKGVILSLYYSILPFS